jgi:dihydroxyacid dehydratase/phosphogluconate dehydratase
MNTGIRGPIRSWVFNNRLASKVIRRHPSAALPYGSALSDLPESIDLDTAKAALEQVTRRLDAELALKTSTETRALTLAGQCTTLLSAITAALLVEAFGGHRAPLLAAGAAAGACLFVAILFAYSSANPRKNGVLPGRLPDELWDDFVAPDMKGAEFIGRLMLGLQDAMVKNEQNQFTRARALAHAILMVKAAVPCAVAAALLVAAAARELPHGVTDADRLSQAGKTTPSIPNASPSPNRPNLHS